MTIVSPMGQLRPVFADKNGKRLSGGKVFTYEPGTLTPKSTYTDALNLIPNTNPINLNGSGEADIYLDGGYRMQVYDRYGTLIQDVDNFRTWASGIPAESIFYGNQDLEQFNAGVEAAIEDRYTKAETYSKPEIDTSLTAIAGGHKAYQTLADAQAAQSSLPANTAIEVTNDGANNGTYQWNGTTLTKSAYDPLTQAKNYADNQTASLKDAVAQPSKNLFNPTTVKTGQYINNSGVIQPQAGWSTSDYIPVTAGLSYAVSGEARRTGLAFYDSSKTLIAGSFNANNPAIVTAPSGAAYIMINVDSNVIVSSKVQVEQGASVTRYDTYGEKTKSSLISSDIVRESELDAFVNKDDLDALVEPLTVKDYEIYTNSKNLFNPTTVKTGQYINNSGVIQPQAGWSTSDYIPVTAGLSYAVSAESRRQGLAFFDSSKALITGSFNGNASAIVTAPTGAAYIMINVDSNVIVSSKVQIEQGASVTQYIPFGDKLVTIDSSFVISDNSAPKSNTYLKTFGEEASLFSVLEDGTPIRLNLIVNKPLSRSESNVFNFKADAVDGKTMRALGDDVAPMRMDGTTIGANHGYNCSDLTLVGHGKTNSDVGSVWLSAGKEYVIIDIVSSDILTLTTRLDNTNYAVGLLTHVSGATNTASFTPTSKVNKQWYPAVRDRKITCFVDNAKIDLSAEKVHDFTNNVKFIESYSIMKKNDIVEWIIQNVGTNHIEYKAPPCYTVSFSYTFDRELGCTIYFGGVGRKTVTLADQMITQSIQLAQGNGTVYNYIPKAVEFTVGGFTYNFSQLENLYSKNPSTALYMTAARQESDVNPIDRIVMLNDQVGYATGYLPVLDAAPDVRAINASRKYLEIRNGTLKLYPRLIDSESIAQINDGDAFAAIAYRKYFKRSADRTCKYVVRSELGDYLYLDWHTAKTDEIELPADLIGREFEIFEKSSNVTLLSKFASHSILVKVDSTKSYGYLVIKFK